MSDASYAKAINLEKHGNGSVEFDGKSYYYLLTVMDGVQSCLMPMDCPKEAAAMIRQLHPEYFPKKEVTDTNNE